MKANKKIIFAVACTGALIAYALFVNYNYSKYKEERAILEAEFLAKYPSLKGFEPDYFFVGSVYYQNVVLAGLALIFGGLIGAFVLMTVSGELNKSKKTPKT